MEECCCLWSIWICCEWSFNSPVLYPVGQNDATEKEKATALDGIKRVIVDRLVFAPPFLLLFFYVITILEGQGHQAAIARIKESFWPVLKLNIQVWTVFQYININYVPPKYRVLFGNVLALVWSVFVASKRRKMALASQK